MNLPADTARVPRYERFDTRQGWQAAFDALLAQPGRELRVFDPDGVALQLNDPGRIARLLEFLKASRTRRLHLALHETDHVQRHCPRMMQLLALYEHAIRIHRTHEEIREARDSFAVLDTAHYVRRPVARFFRGALGIDDEAEAVAMRSRFAEIWSASYPAVSAGTVGL